MESAIWQTRIGSICPPSRICLPAAQLYLDLKMLPCTAVHTSLLLTAVLRLMTIATT